MWVKLLDWQKKVSGSPTGEKHNFGDIIQLGLDFKLNTKIGLDSIALPILHFSR